LNHPVSQGTLCLKGWTSYQYVHASSRLTQPLIRKGSNLKETTWEEALSAAAEGLKSTKQKFGPQAIALFGSGRATNEELFLLEYLAEEVIDTPHIFLDTFSHSLPYQDLFDGKVPQAHIEDIAASDLLVLVNSDSKEQHPAFSGQVWKALDNGSKVLSFSTRRDPVAKRSQLHLQITPFTEDVLLKGLIHLYLSEGKSQWGEIVGANELKEVAREYSPQRVSQVCGIPEDDLRSAFSLLKSTRAPVFLYPWASMEATREKALIADLKNLLMIKQQGGGLA
jgi:predicted molibdopterin-dependent oxidoreductase YjgC